MKAITGIVMGALLGLAGAAAAGPTEDVQELREHFSKRFPHLQLAALKDGVYAIDEPSRREWQMIEEFPPYEPFVEEGKAMWEQRFANGRGYGDCFRKGPGVAHEYPRWDAKRKEVVTLALAVNDCRKANGEEPLGYMRGPIASLLAYMAYESRGKKTDVKVPNDPGALAAYEQGKEMFEGRRGQLNLSCAHCHVDHAGQRLRNDVVSPALGHTTGWPAYRSAWNELGTLHRRFTGCNELVRARVYPAQSAEYRHLEYYLAHMSNGLEINGPSARK